MGRLRIRLVERRIVLTMVFYLISVFAAAACLHTCVLAP
jgi:hypothetical protein